MQPAGSNHRGLLLDQHVIRVSRASGISTPFRRLHHLVRFLRHLVARGRRRHLAKNVLRLVMVMLLARVGATTSESVFEVLEGVVVLASRRRIPQQRLDRRSGSLVRSGKVLRAVRIVMACGGSLL